MTQLDEIRAILAEAPSTAYEMGVETGRGTKNASSWLTKMKDLGEAVICGSIQNDANRSHLYAITSLGLSRVTAEAAEQRRKAASVA